ncbi:hypothetical protein BE20_12090 [Sorangium cellulosum]|nr:hypothetical protein BE20_12090 [Sorangium cellulosum]
MSTACLRARAAAGAVAPDEDADASPQALADLAALPDEAWEKSIATPLLVHFRLGTKEQVSAEIRAWVEEYERKLRAEEAARAVLTALRVRGIAVPDVTRERI